MLDGVRVLDLTDHRGEVGPWLLGELGADVIRVEPPGGTSARSALPIAEGDDSDLRSLQFCAYNANKRSVVVDPATERDLFLELAATADIVVESGPPGTLADAGIDHATLKEASPTVVQVVVTPFGLDGPRADQPASELSLACLGGAAALQGVADRAPLKVSIPQVWRHTGAEAAVAALVARARATATGEGQFVDVSAQATITWTLLNAMESHAIQGSDFHRNGSTLGLAVKFHLRAAAADGDVISIARGDLAGALSGWLAEEGLVGEDWANEDWSTFDHRFLSGEPTDHHFEEIYPTLCRLYARHSRDTLMRRALELGATIAPVNHIDDLMALDQLEARTAWRSMERRDGAAPRTPGSFVIENGTRREAPRRPPHVDEHRAEILSELARPDPPRPALSVTRDGSRLPLEGVKVADFSWVGVGPISMKCLADHGATVVRVESHARVDPLRMNPPIRRDAPEMDNSQFFASFNTSKLSIDIDLKSSGGQAIARRLCDWADVVIDSWTPGAFDRLGLGYEEISSTNPSVIKVTTSLLGAGGALSQMAGFGYHAGAMCGFFSLVGWPDLPPDGPYMAYTDTIAPRFITPLVIAALERRERTGEGCELEVAQLEAGLHFLAPEILSYELDGVVARRRGNRDPDVAPQGVYRCAGDDDWCAITVVDDDAWATLCTVIERPDLAADPGLGTLAGRTARHDELDEAITAWTSQLDASEVEDIMSRAGIPAGRPQLSVDLLRDPQHAHRGFYSVHQHPAMGEVPYAGHQYRIDGYDHGPRHPAPLIGEHTYEVLADHLGLDADEIAELAAAGALG